MTPPAERENAAAGNSDGSALQHLQRARRARLLFQGNLMIGTLLLVAVLGMVNYLSFRHFLRVDLSRTKLYSLSDKTISILNSLTDTVNVIVFFQPQQEIYEEVENLIKEYKSACDRLHVEWVDPDRDLARAEELARKFEVTEANVVVFEYHGRRKYVTADDIAEYDYSMVGLGHAPRKVSFKGEQAFSSAIYSVVSGERPKVYFLMGHGERGIFDYDPQKGFSRITREIERDNLEVHTLDLAKKKMIPSDCRLLVIASPRVPLADWEIDLIQKYLQDSGRLLVLVDAYSETGLEGLLEAWGVRLDNDIVLDPTRTLTGREILITDYGNHPITEKLKGISSIFYTPRSVRPLEEETEGEAADRPRVTILAQTSKAGWGERTLEDSTARFDPLEDIAGPVPLAVAVERGPTASETDIRPTRLVVFGDADFVSNGALTGGDRNFFMNALNWLLERKDLLAIAPKEYKETRLLMTRGDLANLFWLTVVIIPGTVGLAGMLIWWRRRE